MFIYGRQPVYEAMRSEHHIDHIYIAKEMQTKEMNLFKKQAADRNISYSVVPKAQLQKYCGAVVHQGIVAQMPEYDYGTESDLLAQSGKGKNPLILVLDQIQDTHNLGAIIRTAEICGVTAIVIPEKTSAEINPTVVKTSAGAVFHAPIFRTSDIFKTMEQLQAEKLTIAALVPGGNKNLYGTDLNRSLVLLVGSEGKGVRKNLLAYCDMKISIPQIGKLDSLNASVSTAVVLFEIMRQRHYRR
jgi:23S rRNA (guanosine2251-2'-O)-methyltransferase